MTKSSLVILLLLYSLLSFGQSWDATEWEKDIKTAVMVEDTFNYNGFRIIERRMSSSRIRPMDTLIEEVYGRLNIESLKNSTDSIIVLRSHSNEFDISHR